jgi:tRNA pseudouridine38-40 synthase
MPRYRFRCEYNGQLFHGWQIQPNAHTVEAELHNAMERLLQQKIQLVGSGRTDAGVHARNQVAHFDAPQILVSDKFIRGVNGLCRGVVIRDLEACSPEFNARYDATERYYIYRIATEPQVLGSEICWTYRYGSLDLQLMTQEAQSFLGTYDFDAFSISRKDGKSTLCTIFEFRVSEETFGLSFHIKGNRFLHRMVRSMVGLLTDVGRGKAPLGSVSAVFNQQFKGERTWAPAEGLTLEQVKYPDY